MRPMTRRQRSFWALRLTMWQIWARKPSGASPSQQEPVGREITVVITGKDVEEGPYVWLNTESADQRKLISERRGAGAEPDL